MRIAVTGCHGQVASSLINRANKFGIEVVPLSRPNIDLARPDTILAPLSVLHANLVVNAAAFTGVDLAESQSELAFAINHRGAEAVAAAAATLGIPRMRSSTDSVFDAARDPP